MCFRFAASSGNSRPDSSTVGLCSVFRNGGGSNIYNILAILGVSGVLALPRNGQGVSLTGARVMIGISILRTAIAWAAFKLRRWEGALRPALCGGYRLRRWPKA